MGLVLKRLYDAKGAVTGVEVKYAKAVGSEQHFSPRLIEGGIAEGWLSTDYTKKLTIDGENKELVYEILRRPGTYCCHCDKSVDDSPAGAAHVAAAHKGKKSPDPSNPSGFRRDNFYACRRKS